MVKVYERWNDDDAEEFTLRDWREALSYANVLATEYRNDPPASVTRRQYRFSSGELQLCHFIQSPKRGEIRLSMMASGDIFSDIPFAEVTLNDEQYESLIERARA